MDKDRIKGKGKEVAGGVQEAYGRATDDPRHVVEGQELQDEGKVQGAFGKVKDAARDVADKARRTAEGVAGAVKDATDSDRPAKPS
jgi:uncharacterized protein YjbJ (UPF0337 family)